MLEWLKKVGESFYNALIPEKRYLAYLSGLRMTLLISLFAVMIGIAIGVIIAVIRVTARTSKLKLIKVLDVVAKVYITVIRGTPMIVQINVPEYESDCRRRRMLRYQFGRLRGGDHPRRYRLDPGRPDGSGTIAGPDLYHDDADDHTSSGFQEHPPGTGQ